MTPSELKQKHKHNHPNNHFFDHKSMKFFGDTMKNYGVRSVIVKAQFIDDGTYCENGVEVLVWELYRKRPVKHGLKSSAYFRQSDYSQVQSIVK